MRAAGVHVLTCPACGKGPLKRETRRIPLTYRGTTIEVDQPGDWCPACGEGVLSAADMAATANVRAEGLRLSRVGHDSGHDRHTKRGTPAPMTKSQSKRKPESLIKLQALGQHRIHPDVGREQSVYCARLEASRLRELKQLAREHGTTLAQELENAIDAYCAGLSRREIRLINTVLGGLNESTVEARRALKTARRETQRIRARSARKKRRGRSPVRRSR